MPRPNETIRRIFAMYGIEQKELAKYIGIQEVTLCRWLSKELPASKKAKILDAVNEYRKAER